MNTTRKRLPRQQTHALRPTRGWRVRIGGTDSQGRRGGHETPKHRSSHQCSCVLRFPRFTPLLSIGNPIAYISAATCKQAKICRMAQNPPPAACAGGGPRAQPRAHTQRTRALEQRVAHAIAHARTTALRSAHTTHALHTQYTHSAHTQLQHCTTLHTRYTVHGARRTVHTQCTHGANPDRPISFKDLAVLSDPGA